MGKLVWAPVKWLGASPWPFVCPSCSSFLPGMDLALKFSLSPCVAPSQLSFLSSGSPRPSAAQKWGAGREGESGSQTRLPGSCEVIYLVTQARCWFCKPCSALERGSHDRHGGEGESTAALPHTLAFR